MDAAFLKARDSFVDRMGQFASEIGLNPAVGSIYALLYMSDKPMSLGEVCEACCMSKGNGSMNLRVLERWGAVRRVPVRGERRVFYEADLDVLGIVRSRLKEGLERRLGRADEMLEDIEKAVDKLASGKARENDGSALVMKERLGKVREMESAARSMISMFLA